MTIKTADELLARLVDQGGAIVSSGDCSAMEIADARARGDFYVDGNSFGYVIRLKKWLDRVHGRDGYMQPEAACQGHIASERDPKVCGRCGTHIDSLRP